MKTLASFVVSLALSGTLLAATRSVTLEFKGWTCGACASASKIALKKLDGVTEVTTDTQKAEAVVSYDDARLTPQKMIEAVEKIGYKASVKQENAKN
jgi:mercuric ion binding protein